MKRIAAIILGCVMLLSLFGCSQPQVSLIREEAVALTSGPPIVMSGCRQEPRGVLTKSDSNAIIDYSDTDDGYVMVKYQKATSVKLKVQITGPSKTTYTYNLTPNTWTTFPLSDGNGAYKIVVYSNVSGTKYAAVLSLQKTFTLKDEFAPFLTSNQYVNYLNAPNTTSKAKDIVGKETDALKKVEKVYNYVVTTLTYDKEKAKSVKSGYLPDLDSVLAAKKGICFDYAALMAGMLRSQGVPCKLVVGYAGKAYHAWISVYSEKYGWINGAIYFDGDQWQRMDPTFASSGNQSDSIMAYIGNGENYDAKYFY